MGKRTPDRAKQAAQRAAASQRRAGVERDRLMAELRAIGSDLTEGDRRREALLTRRDELVADLLGRGVSMSDLARLTGTSRQALMKRRPASPSTPADVPLF